MVIFLRIFPSIDPKREFERFSLYLLCFLLVSLPGFPEYGEGGRERRSTTKLPCIKFACHEKCLQIVGSDITVSKDESILWYI